MADIKISQLGSAIAVDDSDIVPVVSGGNTLKATAAQLKEHAIGNTSISGIGNGSVTGAISALNSDKQPKTLATSITVDGTPQTTVEGALGAINTDLESTKQALTNVESDISEYIETIGNTPLKPNGYKVGETFLASDGKIYAVEVAISSSTTITKNGNAVETTISKELIKKYYVPSDGYSFSQVGGFVGCFSSSHKLVVYIPLEKSTLGVTSVTASLSYLELRGNGSDRIATSEMSSVNAYVSKHAVRLVIDGNFSSEPTEIPYIVILEGTLTFA